jgi:hypothetical protein
LAEIILDLYANVSGKIFMMRLFQYRTDSKDNLLPDTIYSDSLDNSFQKWVDLINDPKTVGRFNAELKSLVNQAKVSPFQKLRGSENTYYLILTSDLSHRTVYIDDINIDPDFIADLKYKSTEEGGRMGYAASGYRPHIRFPFSKNMTSGEQIFWDKEKVYPGETTRAQIRILDHVTFKNSLTNGMKFEFCEGPRVVGTGEIVEIKNEELKKARR